MNIFQSIKLNLDFFIHAEIPAQKHPNFISEFGDAVLNNDGHYYAYDHIENIRNHLLANNNNIEVLDLGAGSKKETSNNRAISEICKTSAVSAKKGKILFNLIRKYRRKTILELGTNLGIGTLYLSYPDSNSHITTIEGCPNIHKIATNIFNKLGRKNIQTKLQEFSHALNDIKGPFDFVYMDGNHTYNATIQYYQTLQDKLTADAIIVLDDIFWSNDMFKAWKYIVNNSNGTCVELHDFGIVFNTQKFDKPYIRLVSNKWKPWK